MRRMGFQSGRYVLGPLAATAAILKASIPADELEEAWQPGAAMTLDDAITFALRATWPPSRSGHESCPPIRVVASRVRPRA